MISRQFFKSSLIYSVVGALPLAASVFLLPFYTNLLSASDFGKLALYISFAFLIQILVSFGLDSYITVQYIEHQSDRRQLKESMGAIVTTFLVTSAIYIVLFSLLGTWLFQWIFGGSSLAFFPYGLMSVITAVAHGGFKIYTNLLIYRQRPVEYFWANIINFVLVISISLAGIHLFPYSLIGPMWGRLLSAVGVAVFSFYFLIKEYGFARKVNFIKSMAAYCYPLVIYSLLFWSLSYLDRFIINHFMLSEDVAVYDFAVKCTLLIEFFQNGLVSAIYPQVFGIWKDQKSPESSVMVNRYFSGLSAATMIVLPFFLLIVPLLVPLVVTQKAYYSAFAYLPILSIGFVARSLFYMFLAPFYYYRKTRLLPRVLFFSAVIQIVLSVFFIQKWGLVGAVWINFGMKWVVAAFAYFESRKIFQFKFNKSKLLWLPLSYTLFIILAEQLIRPANTLWLRLFEGFVSLALILFAYRNEIAMLLKTLQRKNPAEPS
jgi:O-antigen/teichoic acid export membrane protein